MNLDSYKLSLDLRIDWSELDIYNHVNNVAFMKYMQSGRVNFWQATDLARYHTETNKGPMLVSTHCDFKKQLTFPGNIVVKTKIAHIGNSSFSLEHIILNEANEVCAVGKDVAVCYDFNIGETFLIPDWLRLKMEAFS